MFFDVPSRPFDDPGAPLAAKLLLRLALLMAAWVVPTLAAPPKISWFEWPLPTPGLDALIYTASRWGCVSEPSRCMFREFMFYRSALALY